MKNGFSIVGKLVAVMLLAITVAGCATSQYGVEISNVQNIREIYIRNAGTNNWGANIANNIQNIDKSRFSERVDIRVIDTNGFAYSNYNVPFGDAAFEETGKSSSMNLYAIVGLAGAGLAVLYLLER
jgi:hypothetical protein